MAHNVNGKQFFAVLVKECFKSCDLTACTAEQNIFIVCKQGFYLLINTSGVALYILRALQFVKLAFIAYGNVPCNKIFVICTAENNAAFCKHFLCKRNKKSARCAFKSRGAVFVLCRIHLWLIATLCVSHNGAVLYAQTAVNALAFVNNRVEKSLAVGLYGYTFFRTNLLTA